MTSIETVCPEETKTLHDSSCGEEDGSEHDKETGECVLVIVKLIPSNYKIDLLWLFKSIIKNNRYNSKE